MCQDLSFISPSKPGNKKRISKVSDTKTCQLCGGHGHHQFKCPHLDTDVLDGKTDAIQLHGTEGRSLIVNELFRTNTFLKRRPMGDIRKVSKSMPKLIRGLQIHQKYFIKYDDVFQTTDITNVCVECTILVQGGLKHPLYTRSLFTPNDVVQYINKCKSNMVCSWLTK